MITREDLIGKELGRNQWGNMRYDRGLLETHLPGEFDYHSEDGEGAFLANLCLYLLSNSSEPKAFFSEEKDRLFLEHFIFHTISKDKFQAKLSNCPTEETKVAAILDLIKTDIKLSTDIRFHDFYVNGYQNFQAKDQKQTILYCQNLVSLFDKSGCSEYWAPPQTWNEFSDSCAQFNIPLSENAQPNTTLPDLLSRYKQKRTAVVDSKGVTKEYFHHTLFAPWQKSFTQKSAAVDALERALTGEDIDLSIHLSTLRDGTLGKELRTFIKAGSADSLVGKKVTTVREFVAALQDLIAQTNKPSAPSI